MKNHNSRSRQWAILMAISLILAVSWSVVDAQSQIPIPGSLRYIKRSASGIEFVTLSDLNRFSFVPDPANCYMYSRSGQYIAQSSDAGTPLVIQDSATHQVIFQTDWSPVWNPCGFINMSETTLIIAEVTGSERYYIDFLIGQITGPNQRQGTVPDYAFLPEVTDPSFWVLPSPDSQNYFYGRCTNGTTWVSEVGPVAGEVMCSTRIDWVVYDPVQQQSTVLETTTESLLTRPGWGLDGASWSHDSRYLAYLTYYGYDQFAFPLRVFDTQISQMVSLPGFVGVNVDQSLRIHWSPDDNKIALWARGRIGEPEPQDENLPNLRHLTFLDLTQNVYRTADRPYEVGTGNSSMGYWSPDSQNYVFLDSHDNIIYVNSSTGVSSVLDTDVTSINAWSSISAPVATPTFTITHDLDAEVCSKRLESIRLE